MHVKQSATSPNQVSICCSGAILATALHQLLVLQHLLSCVVKNSTTQEHAGAEAKTAEAGIGAANQE
jgi:hypothetical protein